MSPDAVASDVRRALEHAYDPCSQAWQRPLSLVDLGLVREVDVDGDGTARVVLGLTAPYCMAVATLMQAVEHRAGEVPGVTGVVVDVDAAAPWSPALMTDEGRRWLSRRRDSDRRQAREADSVRHHRMGGLAAGPDPAP